MFDRHWRRSVDGHREFLQEHLCRGSKLVDVTSYIRISASQGLEIPYIGYIELKLFALNHNFDSLGFLVVKDPVSTPIIERKKRLPGVLGSNVLRDMRKVLVSTYGNNFTDVLLPIVVNSSDVALLHALQMYRPPVLSEEAFVSANNIERHVRLTGSGPLLIPARSIRVLQGSVQAAKAGQTYDALIERHEAHVADLPNGVMVGAAYVRVGNDGRVPLQIANFSAEDVYLYPRTPVATVTNETESLL